MPDLTVRPIGVVESCYKEKFGIPRQPNLVRATSGRIQLLTPFDDPEAFDGLEHCSHVWLQFVFHDNRDQHWRPKVRPPRLGGNRSLGVFATRSPYRPNAIGLSLVRHQGLQTEAGHLYLSYEGGDLLHGTPILDIKPYVPYTDCVTNAVNSIAANPPVEIPVVFSDLAERQAMHLGGLPLITLIQQVIAQDPRPQYQREIAGRSYGLRLDQWNVQWCMKSSDELHRYFEVTAVNEMDDSGS